MPEIDLYDIILDGFINVLNEHGIEEVSIPNELTLSTAHKCLEKIHTSGYNSNYIKCSHEYDEHNYRAVVCNKCGHIEIEY